MARERLSSLIVLLACSAAMAAPDRAGALISGRIVDRGSGEGLAGSVFAYPVETEEELDARLAEGRYFLPWTSTATTRSDGAFSIQLPDRRRRWRLEAVSPGHARATVAGETGASDTRVRATSLGPGGRISGRVVDRAGKPVPGSVVAIRESAGPATSVIAGTDGAFSMEGVPTEGGKLTVRAPGYSPLVMDGWGPKDDASLTLEPAAVVAGRVVDRDGAGLGGIVVFARNDPAGRRAISGPDGAFELGDLPAATVELTTRSDRYLPGAWKGTAPARGSSMTLAPAGMVAITVVDAATRAPLNDARVSAAGRSMRTDASGRATLGGFDGSSVGVQASHASHSEVSQSVSLRRGEVVSVTMALGPCSSVEGIVTTEDGKPVANAAVVLGALFAMMDDPEFMGVGMATETGPDGRFRLDCIPDRAALDEERSRAIGPYRLRASSATHARTEVALPELRPGATLRDVKISLLKGALLAGRVIDDRGDPVVGATASAEPPRRYYYGEPFDDAATDAQGRFELTAIPDGKVKVKIEATGFLESEKTVVDVANAARVTVPDIALERAPVVTGTVRNRRGEPLEAKVRCGYDEARSDASGHFSVTVTMDLDMGLDIYVRAQGYAQWRRPLQIRDAQPLDVVLEDEHRLRGVVTSAADGKPVSSFEVEVYPTKMKSGEDIVKERVSDPEGRFDVGGLPAGKADVSVKATGHLESRLPDVDLDAGGSLDVVLERGLTLDGRVVDGQGTARAGVRIHAMDSAPSDWDVQTLRGESGVVSQEDGSFHLDVIRPGKLWLVAKAVDLPATIRDYDVTATTKSLDLILEMGATVSGRVVDENGAPIVAMVSDTDFMFGRRTESSADGSFAFRGVAAGPFAIRAETKDGRSSKVAKLEVGKKDPPPMVLRLEKESGITLEVTVTGLDDDTLARTDLSVFGRGHEPVRTGAGTFTIDGVEPGEVRLYVRVDGRMVTKTFSVTSEPTQRIQFAIAPGHQLSGTITKRGAPVIGAELWIESSGSDGVAMDGVSGADGRYVLDGLTDGRYQLGVTPEGGLPAGFSHLQYRVVVAGDTTFDVDLPSGTLEGQVLDDESGAPIEGARVILLPADATSFDRIAGRGETDATGRFRIEDVGDGTLLAWAFAEGHARGSKEVELPSQEPVAIRLEAEAALRLHIVDRRTGEPPTDPAAMLLDASGRLAGFLELEREGDSFVASGARQGTASLVIIASDAAPLTLVNVTVPGEVRADLVAGGSIEVKSGEPATIEVRRADGAPGYVLGFRDLGFRFEVEPPSLTLPTVAPGDYRIIVTSAEGREVRLSVREGQQAIAALP